MANPRIMEGEEQELALFHSYPNAVYYVQSPSTVSHAYSSDCRNPESAFLSPTFIDTPNTRINNIPEASQFTLSRYSSSRGSTNSFLQDKKVTYHMHNDDNDSSKNADHGGGGGCVVVGREGDFNSGECGGGGVGKNEIWQFLVLDPSSSCFCVCFQVMWRFMVSLGVALLVFYLVTKPPPPKVSVKVLGIKQFHLGEGVDNTGVATKIFTCNFSMELEIDNHSKVFGLHVHPATMEIDFGRLKFARSQGPIAYVKSDSSMALQLYVGAKDQPMYGAGGSMQDMLESGSGLPLLIRLGLKSDFRVVWNLVRPKFHYHSVCLVVLKGAYDERRQTQIYNSTCSATSSHA